MCGIAGVFNLDGKPFRLSKLVEMAGELDHRGPDDEGFFFKKKYRTCSQKIIYS